jgi:soluble lytic murein transglycosylase-like protein
MKKRSVSESISVRVARLRTKTERHRLLHAIGGRGATALLLGTALSIGGVAETFANVEYLVQKDLDSVRVVRTRDGEKKVVANLEGNFTGNTVFKLAQVLPDRFVSRELSLFSDKWMATEEWLAADADATVEQVANKGGVFIAEMKKINDSMRAEFFEDKIPFGKLIYEKSKKYDVDPALVAAVIEQESRFKPRAKSHVGARGLMQLMPRTGRWMGARNLYDPEENIDAGVKYIAYLDRRFDGNLKHIIAAYNGGEGNVKRYKGIPPFRETRQYVKKVMKNYDKRTRQIEKYERDQIGGSIPEADGSLALR